VLGHFAQLGLGGPVLLEDGLEQLAGFAQLALQRVGQAGDLVRVLRRGLLDGLFGALLGRRRRGSRCFRGGGRLALPRPGGLPRRLPGGPGRAALAGRGRGWFRRRKNRDNGFAYQR